MDNRKSEKFIIEGLNCATCAVKIEEELRALPQVKELTLDFATRSLRLRLHEGNDLATVMEEAGSIASRIEPGSFFVAEAEAVSGREKSSVIESVKLVRLIAGLLVFVLAIIFSSRVVTSRVLFAVAYILIGGDVVLRAARNIARGKIFDEHFLMTIATIGAFAVNEFPEAVAVMLFYQIGEMFQAAAVRRSRKSIADLMDIRPEFAGLVTDGQIKRVRPEAVRVGDRIAVRPGEKVPLDGIVVDGEGFLNTSALTGESKPTRVQREDRVLSGSISLDGLLTLEVTACYEDSTVAGILELVEKSSLKKAKTEQFITRFARFYTPAVVFLALALAVLPPLLVPGENFSTWIHRALVFLVVSCPCALVISIPLGFFGGIAAASAKGILIKGGQYLEALNHVDTVVFDKTGTMTEGAFELRDIRAAAPFDGESLLRYAAYAESHSGHPIAVSIRNAFPGFRPEEVTDYREESGRGVRAVWDGRTILAGSRDFLEEEGVAVDINDIAEDTDNLPSDMAVSHAGSIVHVAVDGVYAGNLLVSDRIKDGAAEVIRALKELGISRTVMLTGDNRSVAEAVGSKIGLDEVHAGLLPGQKVDRLESIQAQSAKGAKTLFVGDGINDAPVIARADIGVAMGGLGSDAAIEAADIVLMTDEPGKLVQAFRIASKTRAVVRQNIIFAMGVKLIVLILGAVGMSNMWEAVFADVGVSLLAILNAMRIIRER